MLCYEHAPILLLQYQLSVTTHQVPPKRIRQQSNVSFATSKVLSTYNSPAEDHYHLWLVTQMPTWLAYRDTRRSTASFDFNVSGGAISWSSKRQPTVALSTCKAEHMGQTQPTKETNWLRDLPHWLENPASKGPSLAPDQS